MGALLSVLPSFLQAHIQAKLADSLKHEPFRLIDSSGERRRQFLHAAAVRDHGRRFPGQQ